MILKNKNALITGSSRGIGFALLEKFAAEGCNIYAHSREPNIEFEKKTREISRKNNVEIQHVHFDLEKTLEIRMAVKSIIKAKAPIDILVNSAGIIHGGLFQMTPIQTIKNVFSVNFFGMLEITQLVSKYMTRKKTGSIINIASVAGIDLGTGNCAYGTSKAAVIAFSKTLSSELGAHGIRVNVVAPSLTDTEMAYTTEAKKEREILSGNKEPYKRMARPDEIANVVCFLASEKASFINGEVIRVDGGNRFNSII
jgi:3-oxoacyl-[acyl-carrier protein] reductase